MKKSNPFTNLILSTVTDASLGASNLAASCCLTRWTWVSSNLGFFAVLSVVSSAVLLTWVGISRGADLSIDNDVAVSPFK